MDLVVFMDKSSIGAGQPWRARIAAGIASSALFLAFVSPAYLRSAHCCEEVQLFLAAQGERLLIPLLYGEAARIARDFEGHPTWGELEKLQFIDVTQLRRAEPGSKAWLKRVELIATGIDDAVSGATV